MENTKFGEKLNVQSWVSKACNHKVRNPKVETYLKIACWRASITKLKITKLAIILNNMKLGIAGCESQLGNRGIKLRKDNNLGKCSENSRDHLVAILVWERPILQIQI